MNTITKIVLGLVVIGLGAVVALNLKGGTETASVQPTPTGDAIVAVTIPTSLTDQEKQGQTAYNAVCAACHGENGAGRKGMGPPFVHVIYEPSHHGDMAFAIAVQNGVRAHHWPFGNMPPQAGLTGVDVANIVSYVRAVQRTNGI